MKFTLVSKSLLTNDSKGPLVVCGTLTRHHQHFKRAGTCFEDLPWPHASWAKIGYIPAEKGEKMPVAKAAKEVIVHGGTKKEIKA